jgi:hypothetical protein
MAVRNARTAKTGAGVSGGSNSPVASASMLNQDNADMHGDILKLTDAGLARSWIRQPVQHIARETQSRSLRSSDAFPTRARSFK